MDFQYSSIVEPSTYDLQGLCDGIPLRLHHDADLEDIGALRAQEDWRKHVSPVYNYRGGLGPRFGFMSVSVPECLPERLEIISYANEFAFLHDGQCPTVTIYTKSHFRYADITDISTQDVIEKENTDMMDAFRKVVQTGHASLESFGKKRIQGQILLEMMAIDHERALTTAKSWAKFVQTASGKEHHKVFATLEEYLPYRSIDVGQMFWHGMVTFGMGLTIPEEEMPLCEKLMKPAWHAASLQNDLFSYDKEYRDAVRHGQADVVNAVWVIMKEHGIDVDEAKQLCRVKIKEAVAQYLQIVETTRNNDSISLDLRKYVEAMQYSLSGNVAWSVACPRYHEKATYNELQLKRMKYGIARYPSSLSIAKGNQRTSSRKAMAFFFTILPIAILLWGYYSTFQ